MGKTGKETREYLAGYLSLKRMIRSQEMLVETMSRDLYTLKASGLSVRGSSIGDPTGNRVTALDEEEYILKQLRNMLGWRKGMIDAYINTITDAMVKVLIYQRYIVGKTWKQLTVRYGAGQSESSMRMMVVRYTDHHPITFLR